MIYPKGKRSEFVGIGCLIQATGIILAIMAVGVFGDFGLIPGFILFAVCLVAGSLKAKQWTCGACGNPLANKDVKICPVCRQFLR